ncbi:MAG: hypothetical protein OHK0040_06860 [bacterium]
MARTKRLKVNGADAYYHIISRTVGKEFFLGDREKDKLQQFIFLYSRLFFVKVIGFCIMDNHFHLLIKMHDHSHYSDEEILQRLSEFYNKESWQFKDQLDFYRKKLGDLSEYVKSIKNSFSRWFNKINDRSGYFWGDRFKSVLVEEGGALLNMLIYIDLNPVRAGIVDKPEDYRWSSISYRMLQKGENFLSFDGIYDEDIEGLKRYLDTLYMAGVYKNIEEKDCQDQNSKLSKNAIFMRRLRYMTEGLVIGSKSFINDIYSKFEGVINKKERKAHNTSLSNQIFSLRRVKS